MGQEENLRKGCHTRVVRSLRKSNQRDMSEKRQALDQILSQSVETSIRRLFDCPERLRALAAYCRNITITLIDPD